eukprot:6187001-Pleurochrysis_carterae.AAC.2
MDHSREWFRITSRAVTRLSLTLRSPLRLREDSFIQMIYSKDIETRSFDRCMDVATAHGFSYS